MGVRSHMASYTTLRSMDCPRGNGIGVTWSEVHSGCIMVGEGDWDPGDRKNRNGADVMV